MTTPSPPSGCVALCAYRFSPATSCCVGVSMSQKSEFKDYVEELLAPLGQIRCRAMFGGFGVYCNDYFVAIIVDGVLFMKTNQSTKQKFLDEGCKPFEYNGRDGRKVAMSYYELPSSAHRFHRSNSTVARPGPQSREKCREEKALRP